MNPDHQLELKLAPATFAIDPHPIPKSIIFFCEPNVWFMKITTNGISFNIEAYPDLTHDDFALKVIDTLEKNFTVKFEKRKHD